MSLMRRTNNWLPSVFDDMFNTDWLTTHENFGHIGTNTPAVNVKENADEFVVEVAAPGKKKDDFEIEVNHNVLTISSETEMENKSEDNNERFTRREYSYHSFKRSFNLPDSVDHSKISANYTDGVLKIELPKREESKVKPKRLIEIA